MNYVGHVFRKTFQKYVPPMLLVGWCIFSSVLAYRAQGKAILIGIDENGTRIISASDDPLYKTELVNFIRRFVSVLYNFDENSFNENVGTASELMSLKLWTEEKDKILSLSKSVKAEKISQMTTLKSIAKAKDGSIIAIVHTSEMTRFKKSEFDQEIIFGVQKAKDRTSTNPWGMEITSIQEKRI